MRLHLASLPLPRHFTVPVLLSRFNILRIISMLVSGHFLFISDIEKAELMPAIALRMFLQILVP